MDYKEKVIALLNSQELSNEQKEKLEDIFPELKESEDEKIRKALIHLVEKSNEQGGYALHRNEAEKMLAWLEKQDERDEEILILKDQIESLHAAIKAIRETHRIELEKQGEQKPKFRVGDTIKCKYDDRQFTIESIDLEKRVYIYTEKGCSNDIDYTDEEFELVEQKPVEWSEHDKIIIDAILIALNVICREKGQDYIYINNNKYKIITADIKDWLKSLRPQKHWKPSEEQIKSVKEAACYSSVFSEKTIDNLISLSKQLKKLREE